MVGSVSFREPIKQASDIAKTADRANQARQAAKASREAFEEVVEKTIKSGGDVVKDGRVIATSAKKAAQRSYEVVAKVNNKIADVQSKIFSKIKNSTSKLQAYGKNKFENVATKVKDSNMYCNAKSYVTKKPSCFTADTLIKTENGLKPISQVVVGEKIQSVNEDDVEEDSELKTITNVIKTETDTLVNIVVDGEKIQTTKTHPWYVEGKGFTDAEYIIAGDRVLTANGELKVVESIEVEILDEPIIVYNLEVEDNRTYYVGNNEILVHNMCAKPSASTTKKLGGYVKNDVDIYENLSPQINRAPGNKNIATDNRVQAHHPIQNEWAERNIDGYDKGKAPSILLESSSGKPHAKISSEQRKRRKEKGYGTDIMHEFNTSYKEMIDAGGDMKGARKAIRSAYKYFDELGGFK